MTPTQKQKLLDDPLRKAKADLILDHPFFGSLALKLNYVPTDKVEGMHIDGVNCFYNPTIIQDYSREQILGSLAQNVMHAALGHTLRRGDRDQKKWDKACDNAVNILLHDSQGLELPPNSPCDMQYKDMSAEAIYNKLPEEDDGDKDGDGNGAPNMSGILDAPTNGEPKDDPTDGEGKTSPMSQQEMEDDWKISTKQAAKAAKMQGNLPGHLEDMLEGILDPKVPWKEILRRFLTSNNKDDYSWSRGNRRHLAQGLYLPSAWTEALGDIVIAIDTSASVSQAELEQFQGEINAILEDCPPSKMHVIQCDTEIKDVQEYDPTDLPLEIKVKGRGGTYFKPVFDYVDQHAIQPECLVYLTDLYADSDFTPPDYPTLWIGTDRQGPIPKFGEVTYLEITD